MGGEKTGPNPTDRGKGGVKRSLLTDGHGVPLGLAIDGANRNDMKLVRATIDSIVVARPAPRDERPQGMCLDKGYDYAEVREILAEFGFTAHIRSRGEEAEEVAVLAPVAIRGDLLQHVAAMLPSGSHGAGHPRPGRPRWGRPRAWAGPALACQGWPARSPDVAAPY